MWKCSLETSRGSAKIEQLVRSRQNSAGNARMGEAPVGDVGARSRDGGVEHVEGLSSTLPSSRLLAVEVLSCQPPNRLAIKAELDGHRVENSAVP
jgi:hypothetical protein